MPYSLKQIHCRPWTLNGLSLELIESHYENNYGGALRRLNAITEQLGSLDFEKAPGHVINGLKREELVALNSTLLHELYFASLGGDGKPTQTMIDALSAQFGSFDRWRTQFRAMGYALGGGSGWVVLTYIPRDGLLLNQYAAEHSQAAVSGVPILALDMYEHAFHMDFAANARAYVDTFLRNVDWPAVEERYEDATKVAPPRPLIQPEFADVPSIGVEEVRQLLASKAPVQVIDVRPRHSLSRQQDIAEGVQWRDPDRLQDWMGDLSKSEPVVVYCAYGFHVGCGTASKLRDAGFDAKFMNSGHSGWKAVGAPVRLNR
ncbi:MAG TPA: Fe-Mn family superoxide dismutase [Casimicrobiaceae bacterium]|jgi:superoxide dismutase, Fe-Mn family|nr:Fe-Mn family superoxide dismutase [Casimicrobiaceae bacterium]